MRMIRVEPTRFRIHAIHIARTPGQVEMSLTSDGPFDEEWLMSVFNSAVSVRIVPDDEETADPNAPRTASVELPIS